VGKKAKKIRIFSALEVANICGVVNQTAINWIKSKHLKAFTTPGGQYRIYADDLVNFLEGRDMRVPEELFAILKGDTSNTILIIDDNEELNNLLKEVIGKQMKGYKIYQAFDGFEAGKLLGEHKPKVILLDIDLPGVDGYTLCKRIKNDESLGNPTVLSISGIDDGEAEKRILREGADAFFPKPIDFSDLINHIEKVIH
jgi:excisionase family DNA binding protein